MSSDESDDSPVPTPNPTAGAGGSNPALQVALQQVMGADTTAGAIGGGAGADAGDPSSQMQQPQQLQVAAGSSTAASSNGGFDLQAQILNQIANASSTPGQQQQQQQDPAPSNNMPRVGGLPPAMLNSLTQPQMQLQQQLMHQQALINSQLALLGGGGFGLGGMNGLLGAQQLPFNMQMQAMQMGLTGVGAGTSGIGAAGEVNPNQLAAIAGLSPGINAVGAGGMSGVLLGSPAAAMGMSITSSAGADAVEAGGSAGQSSKEPAFPVKLHRILSNPEFRYVITWLPHGRSWKVIKPKAFEEKVIPLYFRHAKYASFMRQVNGWGFKRMAQGPDHNSYYHEKFLRGMPQEVLKMRRPVKAKPGETSPSPDSSEKPDFYAMSKLNPLPDIDGSVPPLTNIDASTLEKPKKQSKSKKKNKSKSSAKKGSNGGGDAGNSNGQRKADLVRKLKEVIGDDTGASPEDIASHILASSRNSGGMPAPVAGAVMGGIPAVPVIQNGLVGQMAMQQLQQSNPGMLLQLLHHQQLLQQPLAPPSLAMPQHSSVASVPAPAPQMPTQGTDAANAQDTKSVSSAADGKQDGVPV